MILAFVIFVVSSIFIYRLEERVHETEKKYSELKLKYYILNKKYKDMLSRNIGSNEYKSERFMHTEEGEDNELD